MLNNVKQLFLLFYVKVREGELTLYNTGQLQKQPCMRENCKSASVIGLEVR